MENVLEFGGFGVTHKATHLPSQQANLLKRLHGNFAWQPGSFAAS